MDDPNDHPSLQKGVRKGTAQRRPGKVNDGATAAAERNT